MSEPAPTQGPTPPPCPAPRKRCTIYIDAFNWYYGIFIHRPEWKWLNIQSLFEALRLDEEVVRICFFTAIVHPNQHRSEKRDRQKRYLAALKSLPKVEIVLGKCQERTVTCQANVCPHNLQYQVGEEKKTDVNIAIRLIDDALHQRTDSMVIVSADSDLEPAVEWVRKNHPGIKITVYVPTLPDEAAQRRNDHYLRMKVQCRPLPLNEIPRHLLPTKVPLPDGSLVERPSLD
ncbi:MAG: NYN domain-containing protein [Verrucomicrobiota bacterium]|jgi:uncharacterized LabA/DUF88 family protein